MSWSDPDREDTTTYKVVVNHEEQYSIWPADHALPLGWSEVGKTGMKAECLSYITEVWTDMRPLSLRRQMDEAARRRAQEPPQENFAPSEPQGDDLVQRLANGKHPVEASVRPERSARAFKERIEMGYVHIKFTGTRGGTELGVRLDPVALDVSHADFENQSGAVHLEGDLTLNYVKVRCVADIDLQTLGGHGHLVPLGA
jgi:uncharacterized protein YbdZ (MbtH family)